MAIKRFDPENVKSSYMSSGAGPIYRDTMPPFRLESDYGGERSYAEKMRILAHDRRADPLTGELRTGGYPIDFSTASGWEEGPMGIDPSRMDDMDYVRRKSDEYDRLAYGRDAFESAYRTPSVERRMDPYTGEMVDMPIRTPSTGETWSMGELMEPTTEEDYLASEAAKELYMGYDSKESLDRARKTGEAPPEGLELPEGYRKSLRRELASDTRIYGPPEHLRETGPAYAGYKDTSSMVGISPEALDDYYTDIYGKEYTADPWRSTGFGKWSELL